MEDGPPLRVVQRRRAVEGAEEERGGEHARDGLQAEAPSQRPLRKNGVIPRIVEYNIRIKTSLMR